MRGGSGTGREKGLDLTGRLEKQTLRHVGYAPETDSRSAANCLLFDHLGGARDEAGRYFMTDCLGGLQVDDEFELGRLFDRDVGRLCTTQHFDDLPRALTIHFREAGTVSNQGSVLRV